MNVRYCLATCPRVRSCQTGALETRRRSLYPHKSQPLRSWAANRGLLWGGSRAYGLPRNRKAQIRCMDQVCRSGHVLRQGISASAPLSRRKDANTQCHKVTDLMFIVPTIPHLRSVPLGVEYRELPQHESQLRTWAPLQKWRSDPDASRYQGFAPRTKYYLNGSLIREDLPGSSTTSHSPFPEKRVPRKGLQAVSPTDPDFYRLSREQGLARLAGGATSPSLPNGLQSSPASAVSKNGLTQSSSGPASPTSTYRALAVNGDTGQHPLSPSSNNGAAQARLLVNGVNGTSDSNGH